MESEVDGFSANLKMPEMRWRVGATHGVSGNDQIAPCGFGEKSVHPSLIKEVFSCPVHQTYKPHCSMCRCSSTSHMWLCVSGTPFITN